MKPNLLARIVCLLLVPCLVLTAVEGRAASYEQPLMARRGENPLVSTEPEAALLGSGISASSNAVTDQIGTVDTSSDDAGALSLLAEPINPNGKLVHDLALEQVSVGQRRSRARFGR